MRPSRIAADTSSLRGENDIIGEPHTPCAESAALIVGHPGHELLVYGWMCRVRPVVCVLTDGSGGDRESRLKKTAGILSGVGAVPGPIFGRFPDAALYARMLSRDFDFFIDLAEELAEHLAAIRATFVVGDAAEGYNTGHDVCRLLIDTAVALASRRAGRRIRNLAVALVGDPARTAPGAMRIAISRDVWQRKVAAAQNYPELAAEVDRAVAQFGDAAFAVETLLPVVPLTLPRGPAYYEQFGTEQVAAGKYPAIIRRDDHLAPLVAALRSHILGASQCAA